MFDYTLVVTSCGRFDLLRITLSTLRDSLDIPPARVIVTEDSGNAAVHDVVAPIFPQAKILVNAIRLGQLASIDNAYRFVETPFILHCEDDWQFSGEGFLADSHVLLEEFPEISLVSLRSRTEVNRRIRNAPALRHGSVNYFRADPKLHPEYFGYSFNPGLRRLSDYRRVGPFADYYGERQISYCFKVLGYTTAYLEPACVTHIGDGRHVNDPTTKRRSRNVAGRFLHSCRLRADRVHRKLFPSLDPAVQIQHGIGRFAATRLSRGH